MSSEDCKFFLQQVAKDNNWPTDSKWKRHRKYKEGNAEMREFNNQYGNKVLIKEENNILSLFNAQTMNIMASQIKKENLSTDNVLKNITKINSLKQLLKVYINENPSNDENEITFYKILLEEVVNEDNWSNLEDKVKKIYEEKSLYFFNMNSIIDSIVYELVYHFVHEKTNSKNNFHKEVSSKKVKVIYDLENVLGEFVEVNGIGFILLKMGGDWEFPVNAYLYYSTKHNKLKAFFPRDNGNTYNQITQTAYGSENESEKYRGMDYREYEKIEKEFGFSAMMDEVNSSEYEEKSLKEGVNQFKEYLLREEI